MSTERGIVIVGGGLAGTRAAEGARAAGYEGPVHIIAGEDAMPYNRPPLSKEFLIGTGTRDAIDVHPVDWYGEHRVITCPGGTASMTRRTSSRERMWLPPMAGR